MSDLILPGSVTRRTLLKSAAAASVVLSAPALLRGQDPTKGGKRYRTALIGCGWWGGIEIGHRSTTMSRLGMLSLKLGRSLAWDATKERVVGDEAANSLLKREYRGEWKYPV